MSPLLLVHIVGGSLAMLAGVAAIAAPKGGPLHARAGAGFSAAMLMLGATATALDVLQGKPGLGGVFACYFVATSWATARNHDGASGWFEIAACAIALTTAALIGWGAFSGTAAQTPLGMGPVFVVAALCLVAGLLDLNVVVRRRLTPDRRIRRHLWRMCVAFFIATGSFFLGQQDVMPRALQGSPLLFALAFAPFVVLAFWLVRLGLGKGPIGRPSPAR